MPRRPSPRTRPRRCAPAGRCSASRPAAGSPRPCAPHRGTADPTPRPAASAKSGTRSGCVIDGTHVTHAGAGSGVHRSATSEADADHQLVREALVLAASGRDEPSPAAVSDDRRARGRPPAAAPRRSGPSAAPTRPSPRATASAARRTDRTRAGAHGRPRAAPATPTRPAARRCTSCSARTARHPGRRARGAGTPSGTRRVAAYSAHRLLLVPAQRGHGSTRSAGRPTASPVRPYPPRSTRRPRRRPRAPSASPRAGPAARSPRPSIARSTSARRRPRAEQPAMTARPAPAAGTPCR